MFSQRKRSYSTWTLGWMLRSAFFPKIAKSLPGKKGYLVKSNFIFWAGKAHVKWADQPVKSILGEGICSYLTPILPASATWACNMDGTPSSAPSMTNPGLVNHLHFYLPLTLPPRPAPSIHVRIFTAFPGRPAQLGFKFLPVPCKLTDFSGSDCSSFCIHCFSVKF